MQWMGPIRHLLTTARLAILTKPGRSYSPQTISGSRPLGVHSLAADQWAGCGLYQVEVSREHGEKNYTGNGYRLQPPCIIHYSRIR